jgi:two-component system invasion response regulator UvrY
MINIGIADDHAVVRAGLRELLTDCVDMRVVGEAANGREAIELVRQTGLNLDVLVLDLMMPGQSGQDALLQIRAKAPQVAVLILSSYPQALYAATVLRQGASGYLDKACMPESMVKAIRTVASGQSYLACEVAGLPAQRPAQEAGLLPHERLSAREFQVFLKLAKGETQDSISAELSLSTRTVRAHRMHLLQKMELASNRDLTYYAVKNKLIVC